LLNDAKIKAAKATGKRYELVDGAGLYLEVTATGGKIWRYRYRLMGQREKVKIGAYPAVPLTEARARRAELEAMVVRGKSPVRETAREKQLASQAGTVGELVVQYQADLAKRTKDGGDKMAWQFTAYITPKIGRYPLADITATDILNFLDAIKKEAPASAMAIHGTVRRMFDFAIGRQLMRTNPGSAIPLRVIGEKKARTRALSPEEIGILLRSLDSCRWCSVPVEIWRPRVSVAGRVGGFGF
jgi:hypothetical protein